MLMMMTTDDMISYNAYKHPRTFAALYEIMSSVVIIISMGGAAFQGGVIMMRMAASGLLDTANLNAKDAFIASANWYSNIGLCVFFGGFILAGYLFIVKRVAGALRAELNSSENG